MFDAKSGNAKKRAEEFLKVASQFQLGELVTEASHPKTHGLSFWAQQDLVQAVSVLHEVDRDAILELEKWIPNVVTLHQAIRRCWQNGGTVYLCGCGATGRLSLSLEYLSKSLMVKAFMAGGDTAFVHALEGFEDFPQYGERQLLEMGFCEGDLLISSTEGGETPFVIGATLAAAKIKGPRPCFLYCNLDEVLRAKVERSRQVLDNEKVCSLNFFVGPMALAGSTRMQASTILMLAIGLALFANNEIEIKESLNNWVNHLSQLSFLPLIPFIERESTIYQNGEYVLYHAEEYAITVFTDTTERSPTFSLPSFDNQRFESAFHSLSYVVIDSANNAQDSWEKLLGRPARSLNWGKDFPKSNEDYLWGFDFSPAGEKYRIQKISEPHHDFFIWRENSMMHWKLENIKSSFPLLSVSSGLNKLFEHVQLKILLNAHSTLVMGRLNRFRYNFMTWVMPTNGKLVDRSVRYVQLLLKEEGKKNFSYAEIVHELFIQYEQLKPKESVVIKTFQSLLNR